MEKKCEACDKEYISVVMNELKTDEETYVVCANCLISLVCRDLSSEQYKNLLKNGHSAEEFLLHSDFYDEDGNALQSIY